MRLRSSLSIYFNAFQAELSAISCPTNYTTYLIENGIYGKTPFNAVSVLHCSFGIAINRTLLYLSYMLANETAMDGVDYVSFSAFFC